MIEPTSRWIRIGAVVAAMVVATVLAGWSGVTVLAAICGFATRRLRVRPLGVALSASAAWGLLLAGQMLFAPVAALAALIGGVLGVSGIVPVLMSLGLAFVLAWPAAFLGRELALVLATRRATARRTARARTPRHTEQPTAR